MGGKTYQTSASSVNSRVSHLPGERNLERQSIHPDGNL